MKFLKVKIVKYVSHDYPGVVLCTFNDAYGKTWEITEKVPVLTASGFTEKNNDHDHCEFCFKRFFYTVDNDLKQDYVYYNALTNQTNWICGKCFNDFKEELGLLIN